MAVKVETCRVGSALERRDAFRRIANCQSSCSNLPQHGSCAEAATNLNTLQIGTHFLALAAAFALAIPIGWDREKRARSAGLRTFPLVALASCGFVQASENLLVHSPDGMAKVIEGLITGIGFIGGGAILKQGSSVHGTATAASLWATGAIGVSVGLGSFDVAITIAVFTFLTLKLLTLVKDSDPGIDGKAEADGKE
jgi:putative Mg2+ transporter-C (MgtC) family protein